MLTEGTEDHERKGVSDDPLADSSKDHQHTTEEEKHPFESRQHTSVQFIDRILWTDSPVDAAPLPPAPRHPMRSHDNGVRLKRKPIRALRHHQRRR